MPGRIPRRAAGGCSWYAYEGTPYDGVWVRMPASSAYRYKTFVHAQARGGGIGQRLFLARHSPQAAAFGVRLYRRR